MKGWRKLPEMADKLCAVRAGLGGAAGALSGAEGLGVLPFAALFLCVVLVAAVMGIGLNVKNADEQVPLLVERLESAALGEVSADEQLSEHEPTEQDRKKALGRATQGQQQG